MPQEQPDEIIKGIKSASSEGLVFIQGEFDKLAKAISADIQKLIKIANHYKSLAEKNKTEWKTVKEEVEKLKSRKVILEARETEVNEKVKEVVKREDDLLQLHKVLENRRKALDGKEADLKIKARRLS